MQRSIKICLFLITTLFGLSTTAAEVGPLTGEWYFDVLSPNGPGTREVVLLQEGNRVIGFIESNSATGRFVGEVDGKHIEFTAVLEFGGQPMAAVYSATLDNNVMSGTISYGLYGKASFTGFKGRRPLEPTAADAPLVGSARDSTIKASIVDDFFGVTTKGLLVPEMLAVTGGRFQMGSNSKAVNPDFGQDFSHVHTVELSDFSMGRFLITNAQYLAFCKASNREPPLPPKGWGDYLNLYPNHPVVNVTAIDAQDYANWLSSVTGKTYRLPTEAEWEYVARAGIEGKNYLSGDEWDVDAANTSVWRMGKIPSRNEWKQWWETEGEQMAKSQPMTTQVAHFAPNAWGFYDMAGNVWEWMNDWYQADYYLQSPKKNPMGPATGKQKVLRGCSWYNKPDVCFIATRDRYMPEERLYYNGFRVVEVK